MQVWCIRYSVAFRCECVCLYICVSPVIAWQCVQVTSVNLNTIHSLQREWVGLCNNVAFTLVPPSGQS